MDEVAADLQSAIAHHQAGRLAPAEALYRRVLTRQPRHAVALNLLGVLAHQTGHPHDGIKLARLAIDAKPDYADAYSNLGKMLTDVAQSAEAITALSRAIELNPHSAAAHNNLGIALKDTGWIDEAIASFRRSIALEPDHANTHTNLGNVLAQASRTDEAVESYQRALSLNPRDDNALLNLGTALKDRGELDEAIKCYRRALEINSAAQMAQSNIIYTMMFDPSTTAATLREESRRWDDRFARPLALKTPHANDVNPDRRLKIGYVSPDFRDHVIGRNVLPLLRAHDHESFEISCFSAVLSPDDVTRQMRGFVDHWHDVAGQSDHALAEGIRREGIDILVDLTLHLRGNRLLTFARRPAPIQVAFAAYPGSPGLSAFDYRLTDPHLEPPGGNDAFWPDKPMRLPDSFWCYEPLAGGPDVNALPALTNGFVTFGCFNNFCKINHEVLRLWARVLADVGNSRLLLMATQGAHRARLLSQMQQLGVEAGRIEFVAPCARADYMKLYHSEDVALDTTPYTGHSTSLDAFWMGVPVPTLAGDLPHARAGLSLLMNLRLPHLVASDHDEFVRLHRELCSDLAALASMRGELRTRMRESTLLDAPAFARGIERTYRTMWRTWCATR
jgi:predicted O-linked N-acetylglucosamine transferase (SPINDLY family)